MSNSNLIDGFKVQMKILVQGGVGYYLVVHRL